MPLISENLKDALIVQWGHEVYNSHIYLYIMAFLRNKGLDNIAKMFEKQYEEEKEHSEIILKLLTDLNTDFVSPSIPSVDIEFDTLLDIAYSFFDREKSTTESLMALRDLAIDENCGVVEEKMREMIAMQQAEYAESTTFLDRATIIGSDWSTALLWDAALGDD